MGDEVYEGDILLKLVKKGPMEEEHFEQRPEGSEGGHGYAREHFWKRENGSRPQGKSLSKCKGPARVCVVSEGEMRVRREEKRDHVKSLQEGFGFYSGIQGTIGTPSHFIPH